MSDEIDSAFFRQVHSRIYPAGEISRMFSIPAPANHPPASAASDLVALSCVGLAVSACAMAALPWVMWLDWMTPAQPDKPALRCAPVFPLFG